MKTIAFCAVIIAASTFTMAVEDVYGWSRVGPHAEAVWSDAYGWGAELAGIEARADVAIEARQAPGPRLGPGSAEAGQ